MRTALALSLIVGGLSLPCRGSAQTSSTSPAPGAQPPVSQTTAVATPEDSKSIDLLVHDRKGRPVSDLKPGDVAITDGGKAVTLTGLRLTHGSEASEKLITFVFGQLDYGAARNARGIALKTLKMLPADGKFTFAVMGVDGRLRLFAPCTSDRAAVAGAIEMITMAQPAAWRDAATAQEKDLVALAEAPTGDATAQTHARMVLAALQQSQRLVLDRHDLPEIAGLIALSQAQRSAPGRKAILYFAQSAQTDVNTLDQMHSAAKAANEAGASIYAIDMNALDYAASQEMVASMAMGGIASSNNQIHAPVLSGPASGFQSLVTPAEAKQINDTITGIEAEDAEGATSPVAEMALRTGGRCTGYNEGLKKLMLQMVRDFDSYYEASYVSPVEIYDGSFRAVTVKPLRKDLFIHTQSGYLALPHGQELAHASLDASLLKVFNDPASAKDVDFRSAALHFGATPDGVLSEIAIEVPMEHLDIREDPNTDLYALHLAVAARIEDAKGKIVQEFSEDIRRHGGLDSLDADRAGVVTFQRHVAITPGEYVLRTAVVDSNNEKAGTQSLPFHVAPAAARASLSDLVLVRRTDAAVAGNADPMNVDPMRYEQGEVLPNLSGTLPATSKDITLFFTAYPLPGTPAKVTVSIAQDGKQIGAWPLHEIDETGKASLPNAFPYMSSLSSKGLPPGRYEITVSLAQGATTTQEKMVFTKEGASDQAGASSDVAIAAIAPSMVQEEESGTATALKKSNAPTPAQAAAMIEAARKRALNFSEKLPNFLCVELIDRSVDRSGKGRWTHHDDMAELLRYRDNTESRVVLEVNGARTNMEHGDIKGPQSNGEFGGLLRAIFEPSAAAAFEWEGERELASGTVQVFRYKVTQKNSDFSLTDNTRWSLDVAFHGVVSIEPATGAVRSVTVEAQDMPAKFDIHASAIHVEYDYIAINDHDYLLPVRGQVTLQEGKHAAMLNRLQFRDYRRFASRSRILSFKPVSATN